MEALAELVWRSPTCQTGLGLLRRYEAANQSGRLSHINVNPMNKAGLTSTHVPR